MTGKCNGMEALFPMMTDYVRLSIACIPFYLAYYTANKNGNTFVLKVAKVRFRYFWKLIVYQWK
jgi:hypothetical protein